MAAKFPNAANSERLPVQMPTHDTLTPSRIEVFHFRAAIREPIVTSFGSIPARNALLIRVEDHDGLLAGARCGHIFRLPELKAS
jgi:hypothetical protein